MFFSHTSSQVVDQSEFSPLKTARPVPKDESYLPQTKIVKAKDPIKNRYIVMLNDDVVTKQASGKARRHQIAAIAEGHAQRHGGKVSQVWENGPSGFSIELPGEKAAIELSENPDVKWVEEVFSLYPSGVQPNPPWGFDRRDQSPKAGSAVLLKDREKIPPQPI